jgi:hypothetical protein
VLSDTQQTVPELRNAIEGRLEGLTRKITQLRADFEARTNPPQAAE